MSGTCPCGGSVIFHVGSVVPWECVRCHRKLFTSELRGNENLSGQTTSSCDRCLRVQAVADALTCSRSRAEDLVRERSACPSCTCSPATREPGRFAVVDRSGHMWGGRLMTRAEADEKVAHIRRWFAGVVPEIFVLAGSSPWD